MSKMEKIVQILCSLAAIVTIIAFVLPYVTQEEEGPPVVVAKVQNKATENEQEKKVKGASKSTGSVSSRIVAPLPQSSSEGVSDFDIKRKIALVLEQVNKISNSTERDAAYGNIIESAMAEGEFSLAFNVAKKLSYSTARDSAYNDIVKSAVAEGEFALAFNVTKRLSYSTARDAACQVIVTNALRLKKYDIAMKAASYISYSTGRDNAFYRLVELACSDPNSLEYATVAISKISYSTLKDQCRLMVVESLKKNQ